MTLESAVSPAQASPDLSRVAPARARHLPKQGEPLSRREMQVLLGMGDGKSNTQIALDLYLSVNTIDTHAKRLFRKLGVKARAQAVVVAYRRGILR